MFAAALVILVFAVVFVTVGLHFEGLALFAPGRASKLAGAAEDFCVHRCRLEDGSCPMTGTKEQPDDCPLWKYISDDMPTTNYGNPFAEFQDTQHGGVGGASTTVTPSI
jgi:hypothetical protein